MAEVQIATRIPKQLHEKILRRQRHMKKQTGIEPSVAAVVRRLLEEATSDRSASEPKSHG